MPKPNQENKGKCNIELTNMADEPKVIRLHMASPWVPKIGRENEYENLIENEKIIDFG